MYEFNLRMILPYFADLPAAAWMTLYISGLTILLSTALGALGAILRTSRLAPVRFLMTAYIEVMRNVPLLILLYLIYFGLPQFGLRMSAFQCALIALTMNSAAYMTEIFRGGLTAIPRGQYEAALSQGLSWPQLYRYVVLPQVLRIIYAPLGNQCIGVVIGSSLASIVAVAELTAWMGTAGSRSFRYLEAFLVVGAIYVLLCQLINLVRLAVGRVLFARERQEQTR